jgi:hypothetical protein
MPRPPGASGPTRASCSPKPGRTRRRAESAECLRTPRHECGRAGDDGDPADDS